MLKEILIWIQLALSVLYGAPLAQPTETSVNNNFQIIIVPGHDSDPASGGTEFMGLKEANLNAELGQIMLNIFNSNSQFKTYLTRDKNNYLAPFADYFRDHRQEIITFRDDAIANMNQLISDGSIDRFPTDRTFAREENSIKLYGINKWANENNIDLVIHLHFNDYPGRPYNQSGKYSGFAIYVPEKQLPNATPSLAVATQIFSELNKYFPTSNQMKEKSGIVPDRALIALGENMTLKNTTASVLIEYGYIYESAWLNTNTRPMILKELAYQTYEGVKKYRESSLAN